MRDRNKREVDFCVLKDDQPELALEVKLSATDTKQLQHFSKFLGEDCQKVQLVKNLERELDVNDVYVRKASSWLASLEA